MKLALTQDRFSYSGSIYQVPDITLRPRPCDPELASRMLCSWMSPESLEIAARLGLGMFFTTVKDPLLYAPEITRFNAIRAEMNLEPARASVFQCAYCAETEEEAWAGASQYFANWNHDGRCALFVERSRPLRRVAGCRLVGAAGPENLRPSTGAPSPT